MVVEKEISGKSAIWGMWDFSPQCWMESLQLQRREIIKLLLPTRLSRSEQHRMLGWEVAVCSHPAFCSSELVLGTAEVLESGWGNLKGWAWSHC